MFGYASGPDEVSLFAVSPAVEWAAQAGRDSARICRAAEIKAAAVHAPPLNTSGVLARGRARDVLRFVEQASCFVFAEMASDDKDGTIAPKSFFATVVGRFTACSHAVSSNGLEGLD